MEIVINRCYGGFGISTEAVKELRKRGNKAALKIVLKGERYEGGKGDINDYDGNNYDDIPRDDKDLIKLLKEWGSKKVSGNCAELDIVKIPNGIKWEIDEYDGMETVEEKHRSWC